MPNFTFFVQMYICMYSTEVPNINIYFVIRSEQEPDTTFEKV